MLRRVLIALLLSPLLACAQSQAPDTASTDATLATEPAAAPVEAAATPATPVDAPVAPTTEDFEAAPTVASASSTPDAAKPAPKAPTGPEPRLGIDYVVLDSPQPTWGQGKIEVVEIFGYPCIHCHHLQPLVNPWHAQLPADVRFEYVPAVFGGPWDTYARGYFAAELMGVRERTHDEVFNRFHEQGQRSASEEELAAVYGEMGVDQKKMLATMQSFGVTAKLQKARQFAMRAGVTGTPTMIVAGKYRVMSSTDRGFPGMLSTVDHLVARERAGAP